MADGQRPGRCSCTSTNPERSISCPRSATLARYLSLRHQSPRSIEFAPTRRTSSNSSRPFCTVPTCMEATVPRHNPLVALPRSQVTTTFGTGDLSKNGNSRSKFPFLAARLTPGRLPGLWLPPLRHVTPEGRLLPYT
ncbi:hypothetical protein EV121DRAFT_263851 [Schizophyllum commune]